MHKLYIAVPCPFCNEVTDFIIENDYKNIEIINTKWDIDIHEYLRKTYGKSQVPLLLIDNAPLYESKDIIEYLKKKKNEFSK